MHKRIFLVITLIIALFISSCGNYDKDLFEKVHFFTNEDGDKFIKYEGISYYWDFAQFFFVTDRHQIMDDGDIMLGWSGKAYVQAYCSYTKELPLFIYERHSGYVYFCEEYDFWADTFAIEGTNIKIVFSDIVNSIKEHEGERLIDYLSTEYLSGTKITLHSKTNTRIRSQLTIFCKEEKWYVSTKSLKCFEITDEFKVLLTENGILL